LYYVIIPKKFCVVSVFMVVHNYLSVLKKRERGRTRRNSTKRTKSADIKMTQNNSKQRTHVKHMNERMNARAPSPDVHRQKHKSSKRGA
jgi:predicted DNA binding CopG/RHH family protein